MTTLDWIIIILFLTITISIGLSYTKKAGKSISNFFLGGRNLPWYIAGISMVATTFAADTPLAVTELVSENGIAGNWLWWNMLLGGMLTTFFFAKLWRRANILTEVELIELRYSGKAAAFLRGFKAIYLGIIMNVLIMAWVNLALMSLLEVFFEISKVDALMYTAIAMVFVAIYSGLSGLLGIAITDVLQFVIAMAGCIILAIVVTGSEEIGGIEGLKAKLPEGTLDFFPSVSFSDPASIASTLTLTVGSFLAYITIQWWASWYPGAEPGGGGYIAQRMMSAKDEKHAMNATLLFQIAHYCIRPWPWIIVALCAIVLYPDLGADDKKLGYVMVINDFMPAGLKGLLLTAFLAAYMSTISTQLNFGASFVLNDLYKRFINKQSSEARLVLASRLITILLMILAVIVTSMIETISGVWKFIIECGAGLGMVLILRWFWWRINVWSEISATIAPFIAYAFSHLYLGLEFPDSYFITVGFTTVVWIVVTFSTQPETHETLIQFYERVKPGGFWNIEGAEKFRISDFGFQILSWFSAVVMTYSLLFFSGKLIFHEWNEALWWGIAAAVGFVGLRISQLKQS